MKNKKLTYVLLPAVIIIWGLIVYRMVSPNNEDEFVMSAAQNYSVGNLEMAMDTFSIVAKYRDPFLGRTIATPSNKKKALTKPKPKQDDQVRWPAITYGGMIKNNQSEKIVAIVNINKKSNLMKRGDKIANVELLVIHSDSIKVRFSGINKYITK